MSVYLFFKEVLPLAGNISVAQRKAVEKYNSKTYKQIKLRLTQKQSEMVHKFAAENGYAHSFNAFVIDCIRQRINSAKEKPKKVMIDEARLLTYKDLADKQGISLEALVFNALDIERDLSNGIVRL